MKYILIILILILTNCCHSQNTEFQRILVIPKSLDTLFDIETLIVKSEDDLGNINIDTIRREIPKVRKIFRKGISYSYSTEYYDNGGKKICFDEVKLIPTGRRIDFDPEMQDLVLIEYNINEADKQFILEKHERINKSYPLKSN